MKTYQVRYRSETIGVRELGDSPQPLTFRALYGEYATREAANEAAQTLRQSIMQGGLDSRTKALMFDSISVE